MRQDRVFAIAFASLYPLYVRKAQAKGRTQTEVDEILCWLTGYSLQQLREQATGEGTLQQFYDGAPAFNPNAASIKGVVCGVRVEDIEHPVMQRIRWTDKLIDELAKGKPMAKILRG